MSAINKFFYTYDNLEKALHIYYPPNNNFELVGLIEYFKITYDYACRALREILINKGFDTNEILAAKQAFQKAKLLGLIENDEVYNDILKIRSESEYIHDEDVARVLVKRIRRIYMPLLRDLNKIIREER